jgi:hypothetical protein
VQQQAFAAVERIGGEAGRTRCLEVERIGIDPAGHVRQHRHRRVAVHEDVLEQGIGGEALDVIGLAAVAVGHALERVRAGALAPRAPRVHVVQLHVEDEFVRQRTDGRLRRRGFEAPLGRYDVAAAARAGRRKGAIQREQGAGGADER